MTDLEHRFRAGVDTLDSGLPAEPDIDALRAGGRRLRRRRAALVAIAVASVAVALALPFALVGGTDGPDRAPVATDPTPSQTRIPDPGDANNPPSAEAMSAAVVERVPEAEPRGELAPVHRYAVIQDGPLHWTGTFDWEQPYDVTGLFDLRVTVRRLAPGDVREDPCTASTPLGGVCSSETVQQGTVFTRERAHLPGDGFENYWTRQVTFLRVDAATGVATLVQVRATAVVDTWRGAERLLPPREAMVALVTDQRFDPPVRTGVDPPGNG